MTAKRIAAVLAVVFVLTAALVTLTLRHIAESEKAVEAHNNHFFQWKRDGVGRELVLSVARSPALETVAIAPRVPVAGVAKIVGKPGTVASNAVVQVMDDRSGVVQTTVADERGAFNLELAVEAGDTLRVLGIQVPELLSSEPIEVGPAQAQPRAM